MEERGAAAEPAGEGAREGDGLIFSRPCRLRRRRRRRRFPKTALPPHRARTEFSKDKIRMPLPHGPPSSLPPSAPEPSRRHNTRSLTAKLDFLASLCVGIRRERFIFLTLEYRLHQRLAKGIAEQKTCCPLSQCHTGSFFRPSVSNDVAAISRRRRSELNLFLVFETNDDRPPPTAGWLLPAAWPGGM